jgi:hypothetical protein
MSNPLPMAGAKLLAFLQTPMGEEVGEGVLGGGLAGGALLGTDTPLEQIALQTALAMGGGIGLGMAGRRLGEMIGEKVHSQPLKDQQGLLASAARMMGNETTFGGVKEQGAVMKEQIKEALYKSQSADMMSQALEDPVGFEKRYGVNPKTFLETAPNVSMGREINSVLNTISALPPEIREQLNKEMAAQASKSIKGEYKQVEELIGGAAADNIDTRVESLAKEIEGFEKGSKSAKDKEAAEMLEKMLGGKASETLRTLNSPTKPITGKHVGKMLGRMFGDEIGILGGMAVGGALAQGAGIESAKDVQIRKLQEQLNQRNS